MFKHTVAFLCCFLLTLAFFSGTVASLTCTYKFQTQEAVKNESREGLSKIGNGQIKHILHTLCVVS